MITIRSGTSTVAIKDGIVTKKITKFHDHGVFSREIHWLKHFNSKGYEWCPKLISVDPKCNIIKMTDVGRPINKQNAPSDWICQLQKIIDTLHNENIYHNDIKKGEVLVKDGKISLIDYGWMSIGNDFSCGRLFNGKTKPVHVFHDETAIERILKAL